MKHRISDDMMAALSRCEGAFVDALRRCIGSFAEAEDFFEKTNAELQESASELKARREQLAKERDAAQARNERELRGYESWRSSFDRGIADLEYKEWERGPDVKVEQQDLERAKGRNEEDRR
jgi:hypothetical protein